MARSFFFFAIVIAGLCAVSASAQRKEISRTEYFNALWKALEASENYFPRRVNVFRDEFEKSVLKERVTRVQEYPRSDAYHHTVETMRRGRKTASSFIRIGDDYYCKIGRLAWNRSGSDCEPVTLSAGPTPDREQYWVQELTGNSAGERYFGMRQVHTWPKTSKGIEYFTEQVFVVNSNGLLKSIDIKEGKASGQLTSHHVERFEYDVSISEIKRPIKQ